MDNTRIIPVRFGKERLVVTEYRMQHDYGQVLDFIDIVLPEAFEARFSNSITGQSVGQIGYNNRVRIPKQFFESGEPIYCYVTVHDEVTDGRTLYTTKVPIKPSTERTEEEPEPEEESIITQAITALNTAVDVTSQKALEASESADRAEHAADGIEAYVERAEAAQSAAENARDIALEAKVSAQASAATASEKASEAISSAATASQSAMTAETASESAQASATASAESAEQASQSADTASGKASDASEYASNANTSAQTASQKASEAAQSAQTATQAKTDAESAKTASQTAQTASESARDNAITAKNDAESARDEAQEIVDGITGKVEQIDSNTDRIESLEDDRYKPYAVDSASGSIASFPDGADDIPLKSCIVQVNPVQDLHGYDHPWPAGGGVNLFPTTATTQTLYGTTFTVNADGTVTVVGTPTVNINGGYSFGEVMLPAGNYKLNGNSNPNTDLRLTCYNVTTTSVIASIYNNNDLSFTLSEESVVRLYPFVSTSFGGSAITMKPMIRLASVSDASYAPYSNICPISGWTGCEVQRTGKNVWDEEWEVGGVSSTDGSKYKDANRIRSKNFIPVKPSTQYYFKMPSAFNGFKVVFYGLDKDFLSFNAYKNVVITTPANCYWLMLSENATDYGTTYKNDISINYPATDHDYHPYTGQTYPITFPSEAGIVYGGYIDPINGELVADRAIVDLGTLNWSTNSNNRAYINDFTTAYGCALPQSAYNVAGCIAEQYKEVPASGSLALGSFAILQVKAIIFYYDGTNLPTGKMVFPLAEPIHYPLTPTEITSLLGQNNIWADCGDISVIYRADTTLYINRLTEPDADMIADSNITSGQYFMVGNNLYRATVNIASGASVIVGTNATKISLAQALNEINA